MTEPCTKESTWGKFRTPVCSCPKCDEERMATMRRVLTKGFEDGPEVDWDYEKKDSYTNAEHGD